MNRHAMNKRWDKILDEWVYEEDGEGHATDHQHQKEVYGEEPNTCK